jgi:tetratricopeptide (TPR) repeat protein
MRHRIAKENVLLQVSNDKSELARAETLESDGQWFLAAEKYLSIANSAKNNPHAVTEAAKSFTRAATCFEIAGQNRDAARAYFEAASIFHNNKINCQIAGELFNRAALNFKAVSEFFNSGDSYRRAATAFADSQNSVIQTEDNIPPVPYAAGKYTVAANCFSAATDAFVEGNELAWARATCWEGGVMHLKQGHGYHAYVAFRRSLSLCIQFDQTHNRDQLRSALPLSQEERDKKVDPIEILEQAAFLGNDAHQKLNSGTLDETWTSTQTDTQMISVFHEFYLEFVKEGNLREAREYYICKRRRQRSRLVREKKYAAAAGYWVWDATCGYGDNMKRWIMVCISIFLVFTGLYAAFGLIEPVTSWIDYPYFSVITMTSLGYGDIHPIRTVGKIIACAEIISGLLMFGMLLTLLNRRVFE